MSTQVPEQKINEKFLKTESICPECLAVIDARIAVNDGKALLIKSCKKHGQFSFKLSDYGEEYLQLRDFYFSLFKRKIPQQKYLLVTTPACNLRCPICYLRTFDRTIAEMTIAEITVLLEKKIELVIYGAEPTCDQRLFEIIRLVKKYQKTVVLYSNGVALRDEDYLRRLKEEGVSKIILQFDGFDDQAYLAIRGEKLLEMKIAALENLKRQNMPVILDVTLLRDINLGQAGEIFEYALTRNFIKGITFIGYFAPHSSDGLGVRHCLMPDEIIAELDRYTGRKITIKKVNQLQKLLYCYMFFANRRICQYLKFYWVYREARSYYTADEMLNAKNLDKRLARIKGAAAEGKNRKAFFYTVLLFGALIINTRALKVLRDWLAMVIAHISNRSDHNVLSGRLLQIDFSTGCDPYRFDGQIVPYCSMGYIYKHKEKGVLVNESAGSLAGALPGRQG